MKELITAGEKYGPAMKIETQEEADAYFEECVQHTMSLGKSRETAEEIERQNFGYYAGYCSTETQGRINRLFKTKHPILNFGGEII